MSQQFHRRRWLILVVILVGALLLGLTVAPPLALASPPDPVTAAWEQARAAGSYHFDADVTQLTVPVAKVSNVGRSSRTEQLHLAGQTDRRAQTLQMHLWSDGGSVLQTDGGVAVKIENGKTFTRRGIDDWQEAEGFADALAPQGDFLAYLQAVRDVQAHEPEQRAGIRFTRYSFTIDGPTFAAYVRDQMAAAMRAKGELPPGVNLDTPIYYQEMTGDGELWVGSNGLPLRQILNLDFPEQRDQTVHAQLVVDFSRFGTPQWNTAELLRQGDLRGMLDSLPAALPDLTPLGLLLPMLAGVVLLVRYRRARAVYTGFVTAVILSMVVGPVLTTFKMDAFFAAQSAKAAAQEEEQATVDAAQAAVDLGRPQFNPNVNPLENTGDATRNTQHTTRNIESLNRSIAQSPALQTTDPGTDTDADGLTNFAEVRVGTDPGATDSDQDLINDNLEVRGFTLGGQTWYADPMAVDSNNDGLGDSQEWGFNANGSLRTTPLDTDNDGRPDLFEPDNDNDGVPDRQDLSPFSRVGGTTFSETNPLQLTLTNLEANKPTFVEFQLRPTDASHLWYAFNVLDWPRNDNQGQVQDVDGGTYADLAAAQGRTPNVNEPFGDLKLVPMLEIRLLTSGANLPPQSDLTPYNISVNNFTADGSQKVVYVPLNIVKDEQSGQRVAFTGRMRYLPTGAWPSPHTVRLVWMVQMLSDLPCDPQAPTAAADGCQADGYIHNAGQVVQSYYEDWTLVGLNVNAQYGAKTALVYEDPAVDNRLKDDEALRALAYGLDSAFLRGRDQDGNRIRDVDVAEIARRFDRTRNSGVPSAQTWGIAGARNILRVETHGYDTFEQATMFTAMTETVSLLNRQFTSAWTADNSLKPTILYAYEQQSRDVGLDSLLANDGYVAVNGNNLTVNMQPTGQSRVALTTMSGVKWTHYCRAGGGATWTVCDSVAYWDELSARYGALGRLPSDPDDPKVAAGRLFILLMNNLARQQGATRIVQFDSTIAAGGPTAPETDNQLAINIQGVLALDAFASLYLESKALLQDADDFGDLRQFANVSLDEQIRLRGVNLSKFRLSASLFAVKLTLVTATTALAIAAVIKGGDQSLAVSILAVQSTMNLLDSVASIIEGISVALRTTNQAGSLLRLSAVDAAGAKAAFIGAAIAILVVWGFFLYTVIDNEVAPFSPEFNRALAETIAATVYILLLTVLSLSVVGLILVGIISLIDAILTLVCELGGADNLKDVPGQDGGCFTIGGAATKVIASLVYNYDLMINTSRSDLVAPGAPNTALANPSKGFVTGNPLTITVPITTHAVHKDPDPSAGIMINFYLYYFSRDNLRSTTFNYSLTQPNKQEVGASRGTMSGAWQNVGEDHKYIATPMYGGYARSAPALSGVNLQPGINRSAAFYLNMGYALPAYECWYIPLYPFSLAPVCYTRTFGGNSSTLIDTLRYDILPSSIGNFMALSDKPGGGVGLDWDAGFEAARDADGDGLVSARFGGLDPNDATANSDNDGLADSFELERRAVGIPYSPIQCDTDNDELTDGQEAQFGSNPSIADSDNDGLRDSDEVWHQVYNLSTCQPTNSWSGGWNVTINAAGSPQGPFAIRVTSDPLIADPDADGISDLAEKQLALNSDSTKRVDKNNVPYHPNVFNVSPITVLVDVDDADHFVGPRQSLIYTTTAIASVAVAPSVLDISAPAEVGGSPAPMFLNFDPSSFNNAQTVVNQTSFTVQNAANRQQLNFTSTVRARLAPTAVTPRTWDTITYQSLAAPTQPTRFVGAAAFQPSRQDSYQIITLNSSSTNRGGTGDIRTTQLPNGQLQNVFSGAATMGNTPADIACNDNGVCMIAWDQGSGASNSVNVQRMNADGSLQGDGLRSFGVNTFRPLIATDGANFVVAYVRVGTFTDIVTAQFDSQGRLITSAGNSQQISGLVQSSSDIVMDLVWNDGFYYLAWKYTRAGLPSNEIRSLIVSRNGNIPFTSNLETDKADASVNGAPVLAHNSSNGYTLLLYQGANTAQVRRIVLSGNNPPVPAISDGLLDNGLVFSVGKLSAAVDPRTNEWLISADRQLQVYDPPFSKKQVPDLVFAANDPDFAGGNTLALACPARASLPVADLRFEEFPGATNFGGATCTGNQCPAAGLPGATDNLGNAIGTPASDYSVRFDTDDKLTLGNPLGNIFSLAFWFKATGGNGPAFAIESGQPNGFGLFAYNVPNITEFYAGGTRIAAPTSLYDNKWHYVVATRASNGALALYLDGNSTPVATAASSPNPTMTSVINIGGGGTLVGLDNLQLYNVPLSGDMVQALYQRTNQAYCVGAQVKNTNSQWLKLNLSQPDNRGGKLTASGTLSLTVDADAPTARLENLTTGQYLRGNTVHTIGGQASDPTSGVGKVEINVNNGAWTAASGAESWAYNLPVTAGSYSLQVRATDVAGNVGAASTSLILFADAKAPTVSLAALPTTPRAPVHNGANVWTTTLSGTAVDPTVTDAIGAPLGSGLPANAVEVLLQGQGDAQGNGWQTATRTGDNWSITYAFAPGLLDATGVYTVSVRAVDNVGNRTTNNAATGILRLDSTGPAAALRTADATRNVITDTLTLSGVLTDTGGAGVDKVEAAFVPVDKIAALPTDISAAQADAQLNRTWLPATVAQPGVATSTWSIAVPSGLESEYQIDLRTTDKLGNSLRVNKAWRGIIDTLAPRVAVTATISAPWFNPSLNKNFSNIAITCTVNDRYAADSTFICPANGALPAPRFNTDPNLQALFPDRAILSGLIITNTYATDAPNAQFTTRACDSFGHCSTASINQPPVCYWIENKATSYVLDISGADTSLGAAVIAYPKNNPTSVNQLWYVTAEGYIQSKLNGYVLDVLGFNRAAGAPLGVWARNVKDSNNQQWNFVTQANGYIAIQSRLQNYFVDTASANIAARAVMQPLGNPIPNSQLWRLVQAPAANCGTAAVAATSVVAAAADDTVTAAATTATNGTPSVAIVTPGAGNTVDARGNVQMSVAAQADQRLKELVFLLDNTPVKTITFAQADAITRTVQTAAVTVATAGRHTLAARATDWSGAQSALTTVTFVADRQPPTVNLAQTTVTKADSYGAQSNILRFLGAASDDASLIAVQVKVGDQAYANASFGGGNWRIAYPVTDPEGKQLAVKVRALDAVGNVTEISQNLSTDLSVADAPDTTLGEKPADPSSSTSASFSFTGSATAVAFECQLDDAPAVPCASPWALNDLSNGSHTFKVAALNADGFADLTPASHTWTSNVTTLATALTAKPEATTTNRSASFSFTASGASGFACSLDGSPYATCTSPKNYDKLRNGNHTFQVRAVGSTGSPTGGAATRYVWRVTNSAPTVVGDQVAMVVENGAVSLVLQGNDNDALTYQIVEQPQHGLLLGTAPNLTYIPNNGYAGPDRFVYRVWDGEAASAPATVNITVRLGKYAVFAQEGVAFEQNAAVVRGDVGVNVKSAGPFLRNNVEASFSQNSLMQDPTSRVLADSIVVDNNGVIYNPSYNDLTGKGVVNGTRTTPLALPLRSELPALPTITAGTQAVAVNGSQTLAAGSYGAVTVNNGATLILSGGLYQLAALSVGQGAKVHFQAPSEVRIAGALVVSQNGVVGPVPGVATLDANSIVIHVAGTDGQSGPGTQPRSAAFDQNVVVTAYVMAPNGLINFRQNVNATGAFIGKWVLAEQNAKVTRPGDPVVSAADAETVTEETPVMTTPAITTTVATTTAVESTMQALFLPLVNAGGASASDATVSEAVSNTTVVTETVGSDTLVVETTPALTPTLPLTTTAPVTTTAITTTLPVTAPTTAAANQEAAKALVYLPVVAR